MVQLQIPARDYYIWLWIGANTTGKTPSAVQLARAIKEARPWKKIVCHDNRRSIRKEVFYNSITKQYEKLVDKVVEEWETDFWWELLGTDKDGKPIPGAQPWRNYTLLLDDYHMLCKNYKMPQGFRNLIAMRTEYNIDIIGITHTPKYILEGLKDHITDLSIFYNLANSSSFEDKLANSEKAQAAAIVINEYKVKFGHLIKFPHFPFVHVNQKTGKVRYINMPWENLKQLQCFELIEQAA